MIIRLSDLALSDILEQFDWYEHSSGQLLAERWEVAVTSALLRIERNPQCGGPCRFDAPELQELRRMAITGFPRHLIFYRVTGDEIAVLRVIHGARDLEHLL
ncbi:MAG: type II toxin-antitoxin system RelE/ParE family toxin [Candidatus Sulfotelmatobacter sp.]